MNEQIDRMFVILSILVLTILAVKGWLLPWPRGTEKVVSPKRVYGRWRFVLYICNVIQFLYALTLLAFIVWKPEYSWKGIYYP